MPLAGATTERGRRDIYGLIGQSLFEGFKCRVARDLHRLLNRRDGISKGKRKNAGGYDVALQVRCSQAIRHGQTINCSLFLILSVFHVVGLDLSNAHVPLPKKINL
jgi:hypothetical protein